VTEPDRGLFVTIEGLSAAGKTTLVPMLAVALGATEMHAIPGCYRGMRASFDDLRLIDARFLYFLSAVCHASVGIERAVADGRHVVVESFLARTVAFHRGMGARLNPDLSAVAVTPDVSFHLVCGDGVRRARLAARAERYDSLWDGRAEQVSHRILDEYSRFPMHVIDTTTRGPAAVVDDILLHPLDGGCACADGKPLAGHPDLLSAVPRRTG
jgi:thymidylate kinase